ncbi:hypothetical protein [Synechococcus phage Ssp-JY38]|nr:hypothetical protein [Synechococcus phage Yong-L2-223]
MMAGSIDNGLQFPLEIHKRTMQRCAFIATGMLG